MASPRERSTPPLRTLLNAARAPLHPQRQSKSFLRRSARHVTVEVSLSHCTVVERKAKAPGKADKQGKERRHALLWEDVLGAHRLPVTAATDPSDDADDPPLGSRFVLYAMPSSDNGNGASPKHRSLREWHVSFAGGDDELSELLAWLNWLADPRNAIEREAATSLDALSRTPRPRRRFLVLINPVGGSGRGVKRFERYVAPVFEGANIEPVVQLTERAGHSAEIMQTLPLGTYDCVVTVGGDGSLAEVFQGLMQRADWRDAIQQPIGVVPGGSGNGLFVSLMHALGERFHASNAAFVLSKGLAQPLDLTAIRNDHGDRVYSFLSTEWALISDVDVESERLRALGGLRFTVLFALHILLYRKEYEGTIWYLEDPEDAAASAREPMPFSGHERPGLELLENVADGALANDGSGARWRRRSGLFHLAWVMNTSHAASDGHTAPGAQCGDGYNYILLLDRAHARTDLIKLLLALESGEHLDKTPAQLIKTRAFRIEPARPEDGICVDGEPFRGPVEGQVHHRVARVVSLPRSAA
ncbi:hypothetical protein P43SY_008513 [Pythium insidiosum]|uniref:DAGKc domain-containing protein n=1 Tax=Pythium insidiosum TaxID=114742 RepID=A0AAD5LTT6_PYTIN|nr:hypothetical protein P43SY_008513 [Pythium insidiosum]